MDRSVGRNEDKGGRPRSGDSELSFRGIIHVVCQANGRAGKLVGARNIAFSSASPKKEKMRCVCFFLLSSPIRIRTWRLRRRYYYGARSPIVRTASIFVSFPHRVFTRAPLFQHLFLACMAVAQRKCCLYVLFPVFIVLDLIRKERGEEERAKERENQ